MNKLCLGTVQFGLEYGINNSLGRKPKKEECFEILDCSLDHNINCFDTASGYGNAEEVLGEYLKKNNDKAKIISKIKSIELNEKIDSYVLSECENSLKKIGIKSLYGYLLHNAKDIYSKEILNAIKHCKKSGLTKNIGVSIYSPEDALYAAKIEDIDFIQIPYNVLDQRLNKTDFFTIAKKNNKTIFARSAFLQGLLLMNISKIETKIPKAAKYVMQFEKISQKHNFSRKEAAFLFLLNNPDIDYIVFGVDTKKQLEDDIKTIEKSDEFIMCYDELVHAFSKETIDVEILNPSLWK